MRWVRSVSTLTPPHPPIAFGDGPLPLPRFAAERDKLYKSRATGYIVRTMRLATKRTTTTKTLTGVVEARAR
jgi:hypothetical protein